jgi:methionine-rich copper-binding protein CopC
MSAQISIVAPALGPGSYELRYRVLSADSHIMSGSVHFTIAMP